MIASILASMAFAFFSIGLVLILWLGDWPASTVEARIDLLGQALLLSLAGSLIVAISFGFAINKRTVSLSKDGFTASGGISENEKDLDLATKQIQDTQMLLGNSPLNLTTAPYPLQIFPCNAGHTSSRVAHITIEKLLE